LFYKYVAANAAGSVDTAGVLRQTQIVDNPLGHEYIESASRFWIYFATTCFGFPSKHCHLAWRENILFMNHRTIATALVFVLLLVIMVWSFGSSAANSTSFPASPSTAEPAEAGDVFQEQNEEEVDADLGKWGRGIDREQYLRARGDYIARKRGIEPGLPFNPELRSQAIDQMERQERGRRLESIVSGDLTPAAGGAWTAIGPAPLPNGIGSSGAVSGRVTSIAVDPTNPNNVYLGTAQGGVWRSTNGGTTWTAIFDGADSLAIGALAVAPSQPSTLYVGTGEFNGCGDCFFGAGLYRIDNANTAPTLIGPINPQETISGLTYRVFEGRSITRILVHPSNPGMIWVSTGRGIGGSGANGKGVIPAIAQRGVFRSTTAWPSTNPSDVHFEKLTLPAASADQDTPDMIMEPGNPDNIVVAQIGLSGSGQPSGIYRTTNATAVTPAFSLALNLVVSGIRVSLSVNKTGSTVTVYAATSETPTNTGGCTSVNSGAVRRSIDGGANWSGQLTGGGGFCAGQCFYDMPIAVDPTNANRVYVGGQAASTCGGIVRQATDGGNGGVGNSFQQDSTNLHADNHALVFDGAGNIFCGNDGGVWKRSASASAGTSWTNLNTAPLNTLQFESIAVHPTDRFLMIGGTQDNGTEYQQSSTGNWSQAEGGDGGYCVIDDSATDTVNVNMYHTFFNQTGTQIGFDRAVNTTCLPVKNFWPTRGVGFSAGGDAEQPSLSCDGTANYLHNGLQLTDSVLFYAPMAVGPGVPNTVYFGTDRLYRSSDRGDHMTIVSQEPISVNPPPFNTNSPISTIAIWRGGDNIRVVGLQNGQVWATANGSSTLVNLNPPIPANPTGSATNKFIGRARVDPNNKNVAYITLSYYAPAGQGIWKITNLAAAAVAGGAAPVWVQAGNGIPSIPINAFAIDPQNSNNLYAGTDIGAYFSNDGGANWSPFGGGLPRSAVFDLQIQPSFRILRAATHGRGVWETDLVSPAASTIQFTSGSSSVTEGQVSATVTVTRGGDTSFPATVNYATSDSAGASGCSSANGSARCDYIQTLGTLNFAANETSQQISIPIISDGYVEGAEQFTMSLSNPAGNNVSLGAQASIAITINDSGLTGTNPIDATDSFVREQYVDFLNREPDPAGLNFWMNNINGCGADATCREVQRINTSGAFFLSIEFQETGYLIERIYKTAYGDASASSSLGGTTHPITAPVIRLNEFLPDTQRISRGVVVLVGNWQQQIEDNKQAFTEEFVQRQRFLTAFPLTLTPTQFVETLNDNAKDSNGVKPLSQSERDQLISDLTTGMKTRAQVLRAVAEDQQLKDSESRRAFVLMQYYGYLRRNPNDAPEATLDYAGFEFWLNKLNQANGDYLQAEMVKAFLSSIEYRQRFGS
jgi:Calx-beta domain/Domain of unknown function (DUF4214)